MGGRSARASGGILLKLRLAATRAVASPNLRNSAVSGVFSMASRENQGLHIALILLVMLTVGLCILSFVFYSKAQTRYSELG